MLLKPRKTDSNHLRTAAGALVIAAALTAFFVLRGDILSTASGATPFFQQTGRKAPCVQSRSVRRQRP